MPTAFETPSYKIDSETVMIVKRAKPVGRKSLRILMATMAFLATVMGGCATTNIDYDGDEFGENIIVIGRVVRMEQNQPGKWVALTGYMSGRACELQTGSLGVVSLETPYTGFYELELNPEFVKQSGQPFRFVVSCRLSKRAMIFGTAVLGDSTETFQPGVVYVIEGRKLHYANDEAPSPVKIETDTGEAMTQGIIEEFKKRNSHLPADIKFKVVRLEGEKIAPAQQVRP